MFDKRILVLPRGWVVVGDFSKMGTQVKLSNASVVRRWGTDHGLGQLANEGPQENTKLDSAPQGIQVHELAIIAQFPCNPAKWSGDAA
ncbi:MAG: hypothetical protein KGI37_07590 [Alphaproteobacteria bacterium]|nr:hypothetical protein [Alphaproteobacteria bacterium]